MATAGDGSGQVGHYRLTSKAVGDSLVHNPSLSITSNASSGGSNFIARENAETEGNLPLTPCESDLSVSVKLDMHNRC